MKKAITSMMLFSLLGFNNGIAQNPVFQPRNSFVKEIISQSDCKKKLSALRRHRPEKLGIYSYNVSPFTSKIPLTSRNQSQYVFAEDFSLFTSGTEEKPDLTPILDNDGFILNEYTHEPDWFGESIFQAGGKAYIGMSEYEPGLTGFMGTPAINLSENRGAFVISFKARSAKAEQDRLYVLNTDLYNEESQPYFEIVDLTSQWKEYQVPLSGGNTFSSIQIYAEYEELLIDDISIEFKGIPAPITTGCSDFDGSSFTATWASVEGATSYIFECYHLSVLGEVVNDVDPIEVKGTSYKVSGLNPEVNHYYVVRAKNEQYTSCNSKETLAKLSVLQAPQVIEITDVTENSFTASWTPVENAIAYMPYISVLHKANVTEDYDILNTDFSKIEVDATVDDPKFVVSQYMDDWTDRADWIVNSPVLANGILGIAQGNILSPVFDFNIGNRQVNVTANMMGREGVTHAVISLRHDEPEGIEILSEKVVELTNDFQTINVTLPNGKEDCYLRIESEEEGYVYIDDLKVSVNMNTNDLIYVPLICYDMQETSYTFKDYPKAKGEKQAFAVLAYSFNEGDYTYLMSPLSNYVDLPTTTGIENVPLAATHITAEGNKIHISAPAGSMIKVFTVNGQLLKQKYMNSTTYSMFLNPTGVYIIKVSGHTYKIAF